MDHAPGQARVRIGGGTFLNLGVMVAACELVEIGEHCMFANGCFVTDADHRFDDPVAPVPGRASPARARPGSATTSGAAPTSSSPAASPIGERSRDRRQLGRHRATSRRSRSPPASRAKVIGRGLVPRGDGRAAPGRHGSGASGPRGARERRATGSTGRQRATRRERRQRGAVGDRARAWGERPRVRRASAVAGARRRPNESARRSRGRISCQSS